MTHSPWTSASLVPPGARLVGNLPYYISSPLLRRFLDLADHVEDVHVMLQEEVAERVASPPGSRDYGILSVLYALFAEPVIALRFPPEAFVPPPKVNSAVLRVRFAGARTAGCLPPRATSSGSCRRPSPAAGEPLKTTSKIAMLTSSIT